MSNGSQEEQSGNTKVALPKKKDTQKFRWFFTMKIDDDPEEQRNELEFLWKTLKDHTKEFIFQLERGEGGLIHYQGCFSLVLKRRLSEVKNMIGLPPKIHLEPCKDWRASVLYCSKNETKLAGPWTSKCAPMEDEHHDYYPWQIDVWRYLLQASSPLGIPGQQRHVIWIYDFSGNTGKTWFCKMLFRQLADVQVFNNAKTADIAYALGDNQPSMALFNFTRSMEGHINYMALESIKDGMIFSSKYKSGLKVFRPCPVIVFANFPPDRSKLSQDRWMVFEIVDLKLEDRDTKKKIC